LVALAVAVAVLSKAVLHQQQEALILGAEEVLGLVFFGMEWLVVLVS
jgi:hypothetical protein